jgi:putative nucleotidyltransferase with HDIG domain
MDKIQALLSKVEVLPLSPSLLPKLLPSLSDVDTNFDDVVQIISMDPSLTAKLLQICNSAFFGQSEPVSTVAEAVSRVGYQSVYLLVATINGSNCFPCPSPKGIDTSKLWRHSISTAFNVKFVAESAGLDANLLFTAGLLHDIGKMILGQAQPLAMGPALYQPTTAASTEREVLLFGCTHAEVGAALLDKWNLPAQLAVSVRHHHQPAAAKELAPICACVSLGNQMTHSELHPKIVETPEFLAALALLTLDASYIRRWQDKFRDSRELIEGMSKLPL